MELNKLKAASKLNWNYQINNTKNNFFFTKQIKYNPFKALDQSISDCLENFATTVNWKGNFSSYSANLITCLGLEVYFLCIDL